MNHQDLIAATKQNWNAKRHISEHVSYLPWDDLPPSVQAEAVKDYLARKAFLDSLRMEA